MGVLCKMNMCRTGNIFIRYFVYCAAMSGVIGLSSYLIQKVWGGEFVMRENGIVEWIQVGLLFFAALLLFLASKRRTEYMQLLRMLSFLPVLALIRENDKLLDTYVFVHSWKILVLIALIYPGYVLSKTYHFVSEQLQRFSHTQPFICFVFGCFLIFAFSRLVGQQSLWQALLEERNHRSIGGFVEEIMELLGYCVLLIGSIECYIEAQSKK